MIKTFATVCAGATCLSEARADDAKSLALTAAPEVNDKDYKVFEAGIDFHATAPGTLVTFNLEDADLPELVRLISQTTGRSFILSNKLRSIKATVYAPAKVTAAEAYQAFLSILELNGMTVVPAGRYLKIVESGHIDGRNTPLSEGDATLPAGDRYITRVQQVKNIAADDAAKLLEHFKSNDAGITAYAPTNTLIITDTGSNLQRMLSILEHVDIARSGEQTWIEPLHFASAAQLAKSLTEVFDVANTADSKSKSGNQTPTIGNGDSHLTKLVAEERTNSLIIVATEPAYLRVIAMLKEIDVPLEGEGRLHVHPLQHTDAEDLANTLTALIGKEGSRGKDGAGAGPSELAGLFEGKVAVTARTKPETSW